MRRTSFQTFFFMVYGWHTSATLLISENVDIRTVSARLGHAQTSTTMNIYAHSLKELDEKAADTLGNLLKKKA